MKIKFDFEHCFGIHKLAEEIEFKNGQPAVVIYASNGMMKSSFANTCAEMAKVAVAKPKRGRAAAVAAKDEICDRLDPDKPSKHEIKVDGTDLSAECIFVANPEHTDFEANKQVTDFLASQALKDEYDRIVGLLEKARKEFVKAMGDLAQSSDCDLELAEAYTGDEKVSIFKIMDMVAADLRDDAMYYDVKFDDLFDDKGEVKKFLDDNLDLLQVYATQYQKLLDESDFFHTDNGKSFGTYQAAQLGKAFKGEEYFQVSHKLVLRNNDEITSVQAFNSRIEEEKTKILEDRDLRNTFEAIAKKLEAKTELRDFSNVITRHHDWIAKLTDYEGFRKEVLLGYINHPNVRGKYDALKQVFDANKQDLQNVIAQARQEQAHWKYIVEMFNLRFHTLPFVVKIENQENVLLQQEEAKLAFEYIDGQGHHYPQSKDSLLKILSNGERRAFMILQFLFAIEARKQWDKTSLIVLDDISDSFDYQNKYAIIEYVNELAEDFEDKFKIIMLTHNFDFYRTIVSRLRGKVSQIMAFKDNNGDVQLKRGAYIERTPFDIAMTNSDKAIDFIAVIPFVRNLVEYYEGTSTQRFKDLTGCLHLMDNTDTITDTEVCQIISGFSGRPFKYQPTGQLMRDIIFREADAIEARGDQHEVYIENKIALSIAIRLKADKFLETELLNAGLRKAQFQTSKSQTARWIEEYKKLNPPADKKKIMEKVNMMTPEFIHLNSFMYEPLIDMSMWHLIKLYGKVKALAGA
ncbi:MAG: AAA family ATPase [Bacteroidaceae bacterium]|nr:AAA family ATPase [Bacteroidaceae bacterium]